MRNVVSTLEFDAWLRDQSGRSKHKVLARIRHMQEGDYGDWKAVGDGVLESRIDWGPGLRLYFVERGTRLVILLCGGDKSTQRCDIDRARRLAHTV